MEVTVNRHAHFNAAHRLFNPAWDDAKNSAVFGKCSNPRYHGHSYELIVSVTGPVDPETGYVVDMGWLKELITERVEEYLDHKNLNEEVDDFASLNPTVENIAVVIWKRLRPKLDLKYKLKVTLYETPRNFAEYSGT